MLVDLIGIKDVIGIEEKLEIIRLFDREVGPKSRATILYETRQVRTLVE